MKGFEFSGLGKSMVHGATQRIKQQNNLSPIALYSYLYIDHVFHWFAFP